MSVGTSTLRRWLGLFAMDVIKALKPIYMPGKPFTPDELKVVRERFAARRGVGNVALAVDGTHTPYRPTEKHHAIDYRNYKGWSSLLSVAFVDSFYRFFDISCGYPGRAGDNTVLGRGHWLMRELLSDREKWLGENGVVLGDSGASDGDEIILNPYHCPRDADKCWFNFCHSSTRFFVEETFGRWKNKWRFLIHPMSLGHVATARLIYASAILHNYCLTLAQGGEADLPLVGTDPGWAKFFQRYAPHSCPTCTRAGAYHCPHVADQRVGICVYAARKRPSEMRAQLCTALWEKLEEAGRAEAPHVLLRAEMEARAANGGPM